MRALQSSQQVLSRHNHWQQLVPQHAAAVLSSQRQRQRQQWCVCALALEQQPQAHAAFSSTAGSSTTTQQQPHQQQQHSAVASWPGLTAWRAKAVDNGLVWGPKNKPIAATTQQPLPAAEQLQLPGSLVGVALLVLNTACPHQKAALAHRCVCCSVGCLAGGWFVRGSNCGHVPHQLTNCLPLRLLPHTIAPMQRLAGVPRRPHMLAP